MTTLKDRLFKYAVIAALATEHDDKYHYIDDEPKRKTKRKKPKLTKTQVKNRSKSKRAKQARKKQR